MPTSEVVSGCAALLALEIARAAGLDPDRLVRRAGLDPAHTSDPDSSIPLAKFVALWTAIAEEPRGHTAGLQPLKIARLANSGPLGYAFRNAETVGHALSLIRRHARVLGEALAPEIDIGKGRVTVSRRLPRELGLNRPFCEGGFAHMVGMIHEITGVRPIPIEIRFQFPRPVGADRCARVFGVPARYDCSETSIAFPESLVYQRVIGRDPALFAIVDRYAQRLGGEPVGPGTLATDVRSVIRAEVASGPPSIATIARRLAMSARTLQRRLAEDGLSVSTLTDDVRQELSLDYLGDPTLSLSEIAFMLGYSDVTSFPRAFRRWTGEAPATYRRGRKGSLTTTR